MPAELRSSSHGHTMVLTLHHPETGNALEAGMLAAGVEALNAAGDNPEVRTVVITGSGADFCRGSAWHRLPGAQEATPATQAAAVDGLHLWIDAIATFPKPVLAAVEGRAEAAGFSLVLACDLVVAARDSRFCLPQIRQALTPEGGASWQLAQAVPRALALEFMLLGEPLAAERLYGVGLVNRLSAPGGALAQALSIAEALNRQSPKALAGAKELLQAAQPAGLLAHLPAERAAFLRLLHRPEAGLARRAMLEGAEPRLE